MACRRIRSLATTALAVCTVLAVSTRVRASDTHVVTHVVTQWVAPAGCPDEAAVRGRVQALVPDGTEVRASGTVTQVAGGFRLVLRVEGGASPGERRLEGTSCAVLAESAAVILAMSATPPVVPPPAVPVPSVQLPPVTVSPVAERERPAPPADPAPGRFRLAVLGRGDVGTLPSPAFGAGVAVGWSPVRRVLLEASGTLWTDRAGTLPSSHAQGAEFALVTVALAACYGIARPPLQVLGCAVGEWDRTSANGFGAARTSDLVVTAWSVGGEGRLRWELGRSFALVAGLGALVPTSRNEFAIRAAGTIHETSLVAGRASFGPEVRF